MDKFEDESARMFFERLDSFTRMIAEDCEALVVAVKRDGEKTLMPILITHGDPFTVNGLTEFLYRHHSNSMQKAFNYEELAGDEDDGKFSEGGHT